MMCKALKHTRDDTQLLLESLTFSFHSIFLVANNSPGNYLLSCGFLLSLSSHKAQDLSSSSSDHMFLLQIRSKNISELSLAITQYTFMLKPVSSSSLICNSALTVAVIQQSQHPAAQFNKRPTGKQERPGRGGRFQ